MGKEIQNSRNHKIPYRKVIYVQHKRINEYFEAGITSSIDCGVDEGLDMDYTSGIIGEAKRYV